MVQASAAKRRDEAARARLTAITACGDTRGRESGEEKWEGEQQQLRRRHRQLLSSSFLGSGESEAEAPEEGSAINPRD